RKFFSQIAFADGMKSRMSGCICFNCPPRLKVSSQKKHKSFQIYLDILKIVPEPTMTNQAPLSLMNRLKKPIELSVSQSVSQSSVRPSVRKL
ncbi:hypothetical protein DPMN_182844, partial [Dreissena polymorpha]